MESHTGTAHNYETKDSHHFLRDPKTSGPKASAAPNRWKATWATHPTQCSVTQQTVEGGQLRAPALRIMELQSGSSLRYYVYPFSDHLTYTSFLKTLLIVSGHYTQYLGVSLYLCSLTREAQSFLLTMALTACKSLRHRGAHICRG